MSNIGRSDEWKQNEVRLCLNEMLKSNPKLYETVLDTTGFAYWLNVLVILAGHSMWSVEDVKMYLQTGSTKH